MTATLEPLDGEHDAIPSVAESRSTRAAVWRRGAGLVLGGLVLVGVIAAVLANRFKGDAAATAAEAPDVASAHVHAPALATPNTRVAEPAAAASAAALVVPKLETGTEAEPIAVRSKGPAAKSVPPPEDAPIFAGSVAGVASLRGASTPAPGSNAPVDEAEATLKTMQRSLETRMQQLQGLGQRPAADSAAPNPALGAAATTATTTAANPLFGTLERSLTPRTSARLLGNRSLTLPKGTLFTCALKTKVVTSASGFVGCQLLRPVYSDDGTVVLAERGSHLDGEYRIVQVRPGITRVPVLWTRLRTSEGVTVDLDSPATGELGESGLGGYVDNRWGERIGGALLLSLIDDAITIAAGRDDNPTTANTVVLPNTTQQGSKLAEQVLAATINIPPLLVQNPGAVVGVYVARDVDFASVYELQPLAR